MTRVWPCSLEEVWPQIRDKVEPWIGDDAGGLDLLFRECRERLATCWRSEEAVLVLSLAARPEGGRALFVRLMASFGASIDSVGDHMPFLLKVASDLGASSIRFRSTRRGWPRALGADWKMAHTEYAMAVPHAGNHAAQ